MADLLVKLYDIKDCPELIDELEKKDIHIVRVLSPDKFKVLDFVEEKFSKGWRSECESGFYNTPVSVFAAVTNKKVIGFAAYDATARGFFGPTGVAGCRARAYDKMPFVDARIRLRLRNNRLGGGLRKAFL